MPTTQKLLNGQDDFCFSTWPRTRGPGAKPGGRTVFFAFYHLAQDELRKWEMLTCLHFGVVHPVSDLFLTDQVIYNLHSYRRF